MKRLSPLLVRLPIILGGALAALSFSEVPYAQYFEYDPTDTNNAAPIREGEQAIIPLDTSDPAYNLWQTPREDLQEGREPGLINIQRFLGGAGWYGIPTFFRLPIALTPKDLEAGNVDVAIMGAHTDMGAGSRGAAWGPNAFRNAPSTIGWGAFSMDHMLTLINPFEELIMADYGDAPVDPLSTERSMQPIREFVRQVVAVKNEDGENVIPIIIGGDHSLMYPDVAALTDVYGKGNVGVIHFDAHYDATKAMFGHLISHGQPVYRLIEEGHVPGENFIQVGLRGYYPSMDSFVWMREQGFRYHTMAEVEQRGWMEVLEDIIAEANDGPEYIFISFDIDVMDPAYTPATGTPEPNGLTPRETFPLIRRLCSESNVVGFELVELLPYRVPGYETVLNSDRIVRECLVGIAMRKKGITEDHYLSPLTVDDDRK
jgi:arginase family enzyme